MTCHAKLGTNVETTDKCTKMCYTQALPVDLVTVQYKCGFTYSFSILGFTQCD